jgi:hypothetical protein
MNFALSVVTALAVATLALPVVGQIKPPDTTLTQAVTDVDPAKAKTYKQPLAPDGHPDLEGLWQPRSGGAIYSVLPHPGGFFLGAGSETGIVEGGELPYQPWAQEQVKYRTQHMELDPTGHCHYEGVPHSMYFPFQLVQTPKQIVFIHENMHAYRIIYMDGSTHPKDYLAWMGDSRGHWEGNTLVVDVANNNDKSVFDMAGHFHSDALHVVERFTRVAEDTINYEATLEDPKVFTRPFKIKFPIKKAPADYTILESGCFEGEKDQVHLKEGIATIPEGHYKQ